MVIGYIINTFLFDISFNSGIIHCCVFVFDKFGVFVHIDSFVYNVPHSHDM